MKRERYVVNQITGETTENSTGEGEIPCISEFEDDIKQKKEVFNKKDTKEINLDGKEITGIYGEYFDTKNNYGIYDGKINIISGKLIIKKIKKTIQYFIEIEKGEIEIADNKSVSLDNQKFIYDKGEKEFISETGNYKFNSLDIDLGKKTFSLNNEGEILILDNTNINKEMGVIGKRKGTKIIGDIKDKVKGLLGKKNK